MPYKFQHGNMDDPRYGGEVAEGVEYESVYEVVRRFNHRKLDSKGRLMLRNPEQNPDDPLFAYYTVTADELIGE